MAYMLARQVHIWLLSASAELSWYLDICFGTKGAQ